MGGGFNPDFNTFVPAPAPQPASDFFVSDGFNSIRCVFSPLCKENFQRTYPSSIKIHNTVNMLICVKQYQYQIRQADSAQDDPEVQALPEVMIVVDELKIISFDRFSMKLPASVQYDDFVRVHLSFYSHFSQKATLIKSDPQLPQISDLPTFVNQPSAFEDRSPFYYPQGGRYNQKANLGSTTQ